MEITLQVTVPPPLFLQLVRSGDIGMDMRMGSERLGALVRERMHAEPRSQAVFVLVGKRGERCSRPTAFRIAGADVVTPVEASTT